MDDITYRLKNALPNKVVDEDGNVTDLFGKPVLVAEEVYDNKPALPNKWINPDGSYSTLQELLAGGIDMDIFVPVEELPETGNPKKIYLVPDGKGGFIEYHYKNGKWDIIGSVQIDLSKYSTTEEMINAINAACLATLDSAKAYVDEQMSHIHVDIPVYFWDGKSSDVNPDNLELWEKIFRESRGSNDSVLVVSSNGSYRGLFVINAHELPNANTETLVYSLPDSIFVNPTTASTLGYTGFARGTVKVTTASTAGEYHVTKVTSLNINTGASWSVFKPDNKYAYTPTGDYNPATKKYVDDAIKKAITDVLGGEY